ncbi:MAG: anti-sigma factor family protein [Casimicrobiaceae bacterium]
MATLVHNPAAFLLVVRINPSAALYRQQAMERPLVGAALRGTGLAAPRRRLNYFAASPGLRARLRATCGAMRAAAPCRSRQATDRRRWLTGGALAGCTATMLAFVLGTAALDWRANKDLAVEAVATHIRATLNNHVVEVASSDQHTVKPGLSARLDYSPPVEDMATESFALIGGRLDTLEGKPVATLVYHYRLHTIDVFVHPESAHSPSAIRAVRGFNVAQATGSGMDWMAVSDVSADRRREHHQVCVRPEGNLDCSRHQARLDQSR